MEYIVLDLEWNSVYFKPQSRFINEIIQIGAVKLNRQLEIIDSFQVTIKSAVAKKLSNRVIALTGITNEQMLEGVMFADAVKAYNEWAGDSAVTMTWSNSDLYAIAENSRTFLPKNRTLKITKYLDLQSFIQNELKLLGYQLTSQISLANAASLLGISTEKYDLHTAKDDAYVCALMLKATFHEKRFLGLIKDTTEPSFYERLFFKPYSITNLNDSRINKSLLNFSCSVCNNQLQRKTRWKHKNSWFRAEFFCKQCKTSSRGMISFKQTYDKLVVKKRLLPLPTVVENTQNATV